jgi:flagellar hook-associated protein 2
MSDIYMPGIKSRFDTDKMIQDLMRVERIPKERSEKTVENLQAQKTYWQDLGRRITALRDSARFLYSFQNPFNDRVVRSSDASAISGTSTREAAEQDHSFVVKQIAQADRFLSDPLEDSFKVDEGTYTFSVGPNTVSFAFRGGSLKEFIEFLNRRGRDKLSASLIAVQPGKKSLLIESRITGADNRLVFSDAAADLGIRTGMWGEITGSTPIPLKEEALKVEAGGTAFIPFNLKGTPSQTALLEFEIATAVRSTEDKPVSEEEENADASEEDSLSTSIPAWTPLEPLRRVDDMHVLHLTFSDGTNRALPPIKDSTAFSPYQYRLFDIAGDKTIVSMEIANQNTHRDVSIRNIRLLDPAVAEGEMGARNFVSVAQDAIVTMEGIEIKRSTNTINDLIPGITIMPKTPSDKPIQIVVEPDREAIKSAIIAFVGNYNRLMAEINVLTRNDDRLIQELSYLSEEEQGDLRKRMGVFSGDSILGQFKNTLQRVAVAPYPTSEGQGLAMLAQIGIGTDVRGSGGSGYDPSRLRGYLEIDEKALDAALETKLSVMQQLFGYDTDGDLVIDSGVAYTLETLGKPYTEIGGIIALKTGTIDSRINQEQRRMDALDKQLAAKEASLKSQYSQMEGAYNQMERMSTSLDQFSQQGNNRR